MARLIEDSTDGYLIPSSSKSKYGVRSDPLGKRFGRMKTRLKFGRDQVFHSLRHTVVTLMEQAGIPEGIAADVVGQEKQTITFGLYSEGSAMEQKLKAISTVAYPAPLNVV